MRSHGVGLCGSQHQAAVFKAGWAFLLANQDILRWALCLTIPQGTADCVAGYLTGENGPIRVEVRQGSEDNIAEARGERMWFHPGSPGGADMIADYWDADPCVCVALCAVAQMAATIAPELVHNCGGKSDPAESRNDWAGHSKNECDEGYMLANTLRWAFKQRYQCMGGVECNMIDDSDFLSDA